MRISISTLDKFKFVDSAAYEIPTWNQESQNSWFEAVLLIHQHNFPHILLLQTTLKDGSKSYSLPSGINDLSSALNAIMAPNENHVWKSLDLIAKLNRIDNVNPVLYPYLPAHISKGKQEINVHLVEFPDTLVEIKRASNFKILCIPIHELHDNVSKYGVFLSKLPTLLSKYEIECL